MNNGINIIRSGFALIDQKWGGIYRGGSYVIIGPRKSGRTLLSLQLALECAKDNETCLYFTTMRPRDLMIHASSMNFNLKKHMDTNRIIVVRVNPPTEILDMYNPDDFLLEYMNDIIAVSSKYQPSRIIFDELTPFIGFKNLDLFKDVFTHMLEAIEERNITSFFVVGEPATQKTEAIIDILRDNATGTISIHKLNEKIHGKYHGGIISIIPNVGHTEGEFQSEFWIEPKVGFLVVPSEEPELEIVGKENGLKNQTIGGSTNIQPMQDVFNINMEERNLGLSNLYSYNDFQLLLNNQVALYQSTGQKFHFITFRLDQTAHIQGLLSVNQLQNAIGLSINKRDKFCIIDNSVVLLLIRSSEESKKKMFTTIKKHLPSDDPKYIEAISKFIFGVEVVIDDSITNAEYLLAPITSNDSKLEYTSFNEFIEK
jgi:KaiC/GvpD/RAD55 family RecA-like ATPase